MNVNAAYGESRKKRAEDRLKLELIFNKGLLNLANEEVEERMEICNRTHKGELNYDLNTGIIKLGQAVRERDKIIEDIRAIETELGLDDEQ